MSTTSLTELSLINEQMKLVLKESRRLYRVSLNAMFASRRINTGIDGFVEVTSLLRDFSARLNTQVNDLSYSVIKAIQCTVSLSLIRKRVRLTDKAIKLAQVQNIKLNLNSRMFDLQNEIDFTVDKIYSEIEQCLKLIRLGDNLTVLAKVEVNSIPDQVDDLNTITSDLDGIMLNINNSIMETKFGI